MTTTNGPPEGDGAAASPSAIRATASAMLAGRRALDQSLPTELIPDPVLDILLTLLTSDDPGVPMASDRLYRATTVGRMVMDRYLVALAHYGFVTQDLDAGTCVLTDHGTARLQAAMIAVARTRHDSSSAQAND